MAKQKPAPAEKEAPARSAGGAGKHADPGAGAGNHSAPAAGDYTVLARRYRPQTFADLVGQEPVARALANALRMGRVAHAYLFTGARGVGKTSTARILAKALNCVNGPTPEPCGECDICKSIATGEDVDVLEIDGASNRRIDEVRDIRSNVQYRPGRARYKVYIIDEVHMLTKEAFNALLKTLEEPPPHVKFIFATTEVEKVPITILSRCQRFDFAGIALPRIVERLRAIAEREKVPADPEALEMIARRAGGSMRDAQSLLDQLLAFGGDRLSADQVHHLFGTAGDERVVALAEAVLARDPKKALDLLGEAMTGGLQHGELVDQLIAYWRDLMVLSCGGGQAGDLSVPARHHETLRKHAAGVGLDAILAGLDVLSVTRARLRGSHHGRTLVEMALVRLSRLHDLVSLAQLTQWVGQVRADPRGLAPAPGGAAARAVPPEGVKKKSLSIAEGSGPEQPAGPVELNDVTLPGLWNQALGMVGTMLGSELAHAGLPAISGPNTLVLRFPVAYTKAREYCQAPERLARVEDAVRRLTGRPWKVRVETSDPAPPDSTGGEAGGTQGPTEGSPVRARSNSREEAEKLPLIKRAIDVLGATIHRVDEGFGSASTERTQRPAAPPEEG